MLDVQSSGTHKFQHKHQHPSNKDYVATFTFQMDPIAKQVMERLAHDFAIHKQHVDPPVRPLQSKITFAITRTGLQVFEGHYDANQHELFNCNSDVEVLDIAFPFPKGSVPMSRNVLRYLLSKSVSVLPQDRGIFHPDPGSWLVTGNAVESKLIEWARFHSPIYKRISAHFSQLTPYALKYIPSPGYYMARLHPRHSTKEEGDLLQQLKDFACRSDDSDAFTLLGEILSGEIPDDEFSILVLGNLNEFDGLKLWLWRP